jgi:tetratricopeptide (TPR) repeat protein
MPILQVASLTLCPDPEILKKLLYDELTQPEANLVEEHVDHCSDCQQALQQLVGSLPTTLAQLPEMQNLPSDGDPPTLPGYTVMGRIDSGGMGVVWRIRESEFQRNLAIKVMKSRGSHIPNAIRRFLFEARITGQLAHPSIVPVYAKGKLPDGRLYYTMKLVEGETFADMLDNRPNPQSQQMGMLRVFAQVCQAVAHAHECGVIHRDLKPANIMVGAFGEVQVMDWGLAKELSEDGIEVDLLDSQDRTEESSSPMGTKCEPNQDTLPGVVIGTLPYMSPEQAQGEVAILDPRCDVFSLGAILCEILTGNPPYRADWHDELICQAANGELIDAFDRLDRCGADSELIQLAKSCLSSNRDDRLADAGMIASAMATYQIGVDERRRQAEVERAEAQIRVKEEYKRRRLASGLAITVFVGLIGLTVGIVLLSQKNQQLDHARELAVNNGNQAKKARDRAIRALDSMTSIPTRESLDTQLTITPEQEKFLKNVLTYYQEFASEQGADEETRERVANAALRVGRIQDQLGFHEVSLQSLQQAHDDFEKLVAEFPNKSDYRNGLAHSLSSLGMLLRELGKRPEAKEALQKSLAIGTELVTDFPDRVEYRQTLATSQNNLGNLFRDLGNWSQAEEGFRLAVELREKLAKDFPNSVEYRQELATSLSNLANLIRELNKGPEAEKLYRQALAIRKKLVDDFPDLAEYRQNLAVLLSNLASLLRGPEGRAEAMEMCQQALVIQTKLTASFPTKIQYRKELAYTYINLGNLLREIGNRSEAEEAYRQSLKLKIKLVADSPATIRDRRELAHIHYNLGILVRERGKLPEAEESQREALAIQKKLVEDFPDMPEYLQDLASSFWNLGSLLRERNKRSEAEEAYRQALVIQKKLEEDFPNMPQYRQPLANMLTNLGNLFSDDMNKRPEAEKLYREALAIQKKLVDDFPNPRYRRDLAGTLVNLGLLLEKVDKQSEAEDVYRQALVIQEKLAKDSPDVPIYQIRLAGYLADLGSLLNKSGKRTEAIALYDKAIALLEPLVKMDSRQTAERKELRGAYWGRARVLENVGRFPEAHADWDKVIELSPAKEQLTARINRAHSFIQSGKVERGIEEAANLAKLSGSDPSNLYNIACVYSLAGTKDEKNRESHIQNALQLLERAVEQGYQDAEQMQMNEDLKLLHNHDAYQALLTKLKGMGKIVDDWYGQTCPRSNPKGLGVS